MSNSIDWSKIDYPNIPMFSLKNIKTEGFVSDVYDGDTCKIIIPLHGNLYKWNCRLLGIDTPEIRSTNPYEKKIALELRDKLREKILHKKVFVECHEFDKWGRTIVTISQDGENINEWLAKHKYVNPYFGGTKKTFTV